MIQYKKRQIWCFLNLSASLFSYPFNRTFSPPTLLFSPCLLSDISSDLRGPFCIFRPPRCIFEAHNVFFVTNLVRCHQPVFYSYFQANYFKDLMLLFQIQIQNSSRGLTKCCISTNCNNRVGQLILWGETEVSGFPTPIM